MAYGDLLNQGMSKYRLRDTDLAHYQDVICPPKAPTTIIIENDIDVVGTLWSCNIVRGRLKAVASTLRSRSGMTMPGSSAPNPTLGAKKISWNDPVRKKTTLSPDWVAFDHNNAKKYGQESQLMGEKLLTFAVGDSKLKQKWKSSWLNQADRDLVATGRHQENLRQRHLEAGDSGCQLARVLGWQDGPR